MQKKLYQQNWVIQCYPKRCINRLIFNLSFPQSLSGNPDLSLRRQGTIRNWIPIFMGNPGCPIKNFGHDEKYYSQKSTYGEL